MQSRRQIDNAKQSKLKVKERLKLNALHVENVMKKQDKILLGVKNQRFFTSSMQVFRFGRGTSGRTLEAICISKLKPKLNKQVISFYLLLFPNGII